jgi:hypothetical protein
VARYIYVCTITARHVYPSLRWLSSGFFHAYGRPSKRWIFIWPGNVVEAVKLPGVDCIYTVERGTGATGAVCAEPPVNANGGVAR